MKTTLDYLDNTYLFDGVGRIIRKDNDDKGNYLVLDRTIFYPQGGGQPADVGYIKHTNYEIFISFVSFFEGEVKHYYQGNGDNILIGDDVSLYIDKTKRIEHSKLHTVGHLIAAVAEDKTGLIATKGYHFPEGAYVEFDSAITSSEGLIDELNTILNSTIKQGNKISAKIVDYTELSNLCKNIPPYLPKDKPLRIVDIEGFGAVPCGGTHLNTLSEINKITIRKISNKKGKAKISYLCE